MIKLESH